jgi:hypothetical protein
VYICRRSQLVVSRYSLAVPLPVSVSIDTVSYILLSFVSSRSRVSHRWELYVPYPISVYVIFIFMTLFTFFLLNAAAAAAAAEESETLAVREARTE